MIVHSTLSKSGSGGPYVSLPTVTWVVAAAHWHRERDVLASVAAEAEPKCPGPAPAAGAARSVH